MISDCRRRTPRRAPFSSPTSPPPPRSRTDFPSSISPMPRPSAATSRAAFVSTANRKARGRDPAAGLRHRRRCFRHRGGDDAAGAGRHGNRLGHPQGTWQNLGLHLRQCDGSVTATFGPGALSRFNLPAFLKHTEQGGFFALDDVSDGTLPIDGAEIRPAFRKAWRGSTRPKPIRRSTRSGCPGSRPTRDGDWPCTAVSFRRTRRQGRPTASKAPTSHRSLSAGPGARRSFPRSAAAFRGNRPHHPRCADCSSS